MKKIKIIFLTLIIAIISISCTAKIENIDFYLNPGNDTVQLNSTYIDPGVTAKAFGIKRATEVLENTVDTTKLGVYYIVYNFVYQDFDLKLTRIITVVDETPPKLSLNPGIDTIKIGETWEDASIQILDNSEDEVQLEVLGEIDNTKVGAYVITYVVTDSSGNSSMIERYVNVIN